MCLSIEEKKQLFNEFKMSLIEAQKVYVEVCRKNVKLPKYANIGDAGMDIRAAEEIIILPGETKAIPTGLKMVIPQNYELQVRPRSGISFKTPLRIANAPGTIDSGYRDEIGITITNSSPILAYDIFQDRYSGELTYHTPEYYSNMYYGIDEKGNKPGAYVIRIGDRIAQIVLERFEQIKFIPSENVKTLGYNRCGGFGSTGIN